MKTMEVTTLYGFVPGALDVTGGGYDAQQIRLNAAIMNQRMLAYCEAGRSEARVLSSTDVPDPLELGSANNYTVHRYYRVVQGQLQEFYENPGFDPASMNYETQVAEVKLAQMFCTSDSFVMWDFTADTTRNDVNVVWETKRFDIRGFRFDEPQFMVDLEIARRAAGEVHAVLEGARLNPDTAQDISMDVIPDVPGSGPRCGSCSYDRVVNGVLVEHSGSWDDRCGECGTKIDSYTVVIDGQVIEDVIQAWSYWY